MNLYELWLILARRWWLIIAIPLICVGSYLAILLFQGNGIIEENGSYKATSRIVVNSWLDVTSGYAASEGRQYLIDLYGDEWPEAAMKVDVSGDEKTSTVVINATGPNAEDCVQAANSIAESAARKADDVIDDTEETIFTPKVEPASTSSVVEQRAPGQTNNQRILVAILIGLFAAICISIAIDLKKRPVKTVEGIQRTVKLPVLECIPSTNEERLLANIRFAAESDNISSIFVVPAGDNDAAEAASKLLLEASSSESDKALDVQIGDSLSATMNSAYNARSYDAVVVTARQWVDSLSSLEDTISELKLAKANLVGLVFVRNKLIY